MKTKNLTKKKKYVDEKIRPDTRPSVADGWAGVEMRVFPLSYSSVTDPPTDQPTDRPTDGRTDKASYRVACPQLKTEKENLQEDPRS